MMTKKDFEAIAAALKSERPEANWLNKMVQWRKDVRAIRDVLAARNPRFDAARFELACGY